VRLMWRFKDWSGWRESNPRHTAWEAVVLPLNYTRLPDRSCIDRRAFASSRPGRRAGRGCLPATPFAAGQTVVIQPNVVTRDCKAGVQTGKLGVIPESGVEPAPFSGGCIQV
jgi:hypothetical protein